MTEDLENLNVGECVILPEGVVAFRTQEGVRYVELETGPGHLGGASTYASLRAKGRPDELAIGQTVLPIAGFMGSEPGDMLIWNGEEWVLCQTSM